MTILLVACAATALVALAVAAADRPSVGVSLSLVTFVIAAAARQPIVRSDYLLGSFSINAADAAAAVLVLATLLRVAKGHLAAHNRGILVALGGLLAVHLARGVALYGVPAAINGARSWIWFGSAFAYGCAVPWGRRQFALVLPACAVVSAIAVVGFAHTGLRNVRQPILVKGVWLDPRPLTAAGALLLLQGLIVLVALRSSKKIWEVPLGLVMCALIVALQHRTVWLASAAVVVIAVRAWLRHEGAVKEHGYAASGVAVLVAPVLFVAVFSSATLRASAAEAQGSNSTLHWRTASWVALIKEHHSVSDFLVGLPAGSGWERDILGNRQTSLAPHSVYIEALLRFGIAGLLLLVVVGIQIFRRGPAEDDDPIPNWVVRSLLVVAAVFGSSYMLPPTVGLFLGALLSLGAVSEVPTPVPDVVAVARMRPEVSA